MTLTRSLFAAAAVCFAVSAAPAQPPAPPVTPPTAAAPADPLPPPASAPSGPVAGEEDVAVLHPPSLLQRFLVPAAALLAIVVIALFVIRWRRTGEIPGPGTDHPLPPGGPPIAG